MERLLIINPGSSSTKIAIYEDQNQVFLENIPHTTDVLRKHDTVSAQHGFRKNLVLETLSLHGYEQKGLSCIVGRGGVLPSIKSGACIVNEDMVWQLKNAPTHEHASNLGALIAFEIAKPLGIPAYIYDAVGVDEMPKQNKITGWPELERAGVGHNLNMRATAMRYAKERGRKYSGISVVVAHLGGGFSISLHHRGEIIDVVNDEDGGFTPERAGALPMAPFVKMIFREGWDEKAVLKRLKTQGGLTAHLGTNDSRVVERMIQAGDGRARMIYEAMAMNAARNIAREFPIVNGQVEAILLTGGIAHSGLFTDLMKERLSFLCPVLVYPGENEMLALALGGLRVLRGEEIPHVYKRVLS